MYYSTSCGTDINSSYTCGCACRLDHFYVSLNSGWLDSRRPNAAEGSTCVKPPYIYIYSSAEKICTPFPAIYVTRQWSLKRSSQILLRLLPSEIGKAFRTLRSRPWENKMAAFPRTDRRYRSVKQTAVLSPHLQDVFRGYTNVLFLLVFHR